MVLANSSCKGHQTLHPQGIRPGAPPSSTYAAKFRLPGYSLRESVTRFDYVGRFEDLPGPYEYVCNKLGMPSKPIPYTNQTRFDRYSDYYDRETLELAQNLYREDIEVFDYKFGQ